MSWLSSWFGGSQNATTMKFDEVDKDNELVYDEKTKRYVARKDLNNPTAASGSDSNSATPQPAPSSPLPPPSPKIQPPTVSTQPSSTVNKRPRYVDPFTNQPHVNAPPVVEFSAQQQTNEQQPTA